VDTKINELHRQIAQLKLEKVCYHANSASEPGQAEPDAQPHGKVAEFIPTIRMLGHLPLVQLLQTPLDPIR